MFEFDTFSKFTIFNLFKLFYDAFWKKKIVNTFLAVKSFRQKLKLSDFKFASFFHTLVNTKS